MADLALAHGTRDAMLWYHRGLIALGAHDTALARASLGRAIETTIRSAAAMGFTMVRFDRAIVLDDRVVVRIVASDGS